MTLDTAQQSSSRLDIDRLTYVHTSTMVTDHRRAYVRPAAQVGPDPEGLRLSTILHPLILPDSAGSKAKRELQR